MKQIYCVLCAACCVLMVGCGSHSQIPGLVDVQITVTQEGKTLEKAVVILEAPDVNFSPSGVTDKNGVAVMYTNGTSRGALEGEYKVRVSKTETIGIGPKNELGIPEHAETWRYVEEQYASLATTPLSVTVKGKTKASLDAGKAIKVEVK